MRRRIFCALGVLFIFLFLVPGCVLAAGSAFKKEPKTPYAERFVALAEGQEWFLSGVEEILNQNKKSINTLNDSNDLSDVTMLSFQGTPKGAKIPGAIGEFKDLEYLFMKDGGLQGVIPDELFGLEKLKNIDLDNNDYKNMTIPSKFAAMPGLEVLILSKNRFTGAIPSEILKNTKIEVLDVSNNDLSSPFPDINSMSSLKYLGLSNNRITGSIPDITLTQLHTLSAWNCRLSGEIPSSLGGILTLEIIDLAGNALSGEIPFSLGNLVSLEALSLKDNNLSGEIPASFAGLGKIELLNLSGNKLEGLIPDIFSSLAYLDELYLENNRLRGFVPDSLKEKAVDGVYVNLENNYLTGDNLYYLGSLGKTSSVKNNFCDGFRDQYKLTISQSVISIREKVNIYPYLKNTYVNNGVVNIYKVLLKPDEYEVRVASGDASKISIEVNSSGIFISALEDIPLKDRITIEVRIKNNDGSDYSKTTLLVTTDLVSNELTGGGGGGGGGGSELTPDDKEGESDNEDKPKEVMHKPYISGYSDKTFKPDSFITRAEVAAVIIRALDLRLSDSKAKFFDVDKSHWASEFISSVNILGFMSGYEDYTFRPGKSITRAELASVLVRINERGENPKKEDMTKDIKFSDVPKGAWYADDVYKAGRMGFITGYPSDKGETLFKPNAPVTRAEVVSMMNRFLGRDINTLSPEVKADFSDVSQKHWAYRQISEAGIEHRH